MWLFVVVDVVIVVCGYGLWLWILFIVVCGDYWLLGNGYDGPTFGFLLTATWCELGVFVVDE